MTPTPDPSRRSLLSEMLREVAHFVREIRTFGAEVQDALKAPAATQQRLDTVQEELAEVRSDLVAAEEKLDQLDECG